MWDGEDCGVESDFGSAIPSKNYSKIDLKESLHFYS